LSAGAGPIRADWLANRMLRRSFRVHRSGALRLGGIRTRHVPGLCMTQWKIAISSIENAQVFDFHEFFIASAFCTLLKKA
jgi:hypothetical protein